MVNLLHTGVTWLSSQLQCNAATAITYRRVETDEYANLKATIGRTDREQEHDRGLVNIVRSVDAIVPTAAFESAFGAGERPEDGDTISHGGHTYKVRPLGGEPSWRYGDGTQVMLRIHIKDEGPIT